MVSIHYTTCQIIIICCYVLWWFPLRVLIGRIDRDLEEWNFSLSTCYEIGVCSSTAVHVCETVSVCMSLWNTVIGSLRHVQAGSTSIIDNVFICMCMSVHVNA